jgi:hypothetical protein
LPEIRPPAKQLQLALQSFPAIRRKGMCLAPRKALSIDVFASLRTQSFSNESERQIDLSTVLDPPPQVVSPADAGSGGPPAASSGREKASGRHRKTHSSSFWQEARRTARPGGNLLWNSGNYSFTTNDINAYIKSIPPLSPLPPSMPPQ